MAATALSPSLMQPNSESLHSLSCLRGITNTFVLNLFSWALLFKKYRKAHTKNLDRIWD